ncbi:glioma pathogenesis-related protein 1b isoform X2 [Tachysurus fulvidraco]|uniref:glioma pathogenesis-related protein 1b isoform X2 n=1 Tax=Tachysurus fulvidraco TaxID=1234273 RepID=UPI001FED820A|nr:glioma pathogenesis-related protein 1b isoform X2 [Tachysurus fulvidraco]
MLSLSLTHTHTLKHTHTHTHTLRDNLSLFSVIMDLLTCVLLWISVLLSGPFGARAFMLPDIGDPDFIRTCVQTHNVYRSRAHPPAANMRSMKDYSGSTACLLQRVVLLCCTSQPEDTQTNTMSHGPGAAVTSWDNTLARGARSWARHCKASHNPVLKQEGKAHADFRQVGENIWLGAPYSAFTVESAINSWNKESADYTHGNNTCARVCGHYTQLMWATSYKIGCAVHVCSRGIENFSNHPESTIFVCNYGDAGNVFGFTPYIVGLACSKCGVEKCRDKLCKYDWIPGWDLGPGGSAQGLSDWLNGSKLQLLTGSFWLLYFYATH